MDDWFLTEARKGNVYHGCNTATKDITVLSATCTGLVLENPYGSGKQFVIAKMAVTGVTLTTIRPIGVIVSSIVEETLSTGVTADIIHNARPTGSNADTGKGLIYNVATLASTPVWLRPLCTPMEDTGANSVHALAVIEANFDGTLIVSPGTYVGFSTLTTASAALCAIIWAEIDE